MYLYSIYIVRVFKGIVGGFSSRILALTARLNIPLQLVLLCFSNKGVFRPSFICLSMDWNENTRKKINFTKLVFLKSFGSNPKHKFFFDLK
jgi:hypothetical protein